MLAAQLPEIDRQPAPALEASFVTAGEISPRYASPGAAPGVPVRAVKWMFQEHALLIIQPKMDWTKPSCLARTLMNCTAEACAVNKSRLVRPAEYSRDCLIDLRSETGISDDERTQEHVRKVAAQRQGVAVVRSPDEADRALLTFLT